ncbi:MAG TPA: TRAP transporter small permease subunit [Paracoccus sp.]|nr:TRAP transporter small permease subunit [Paracoccus sp. (in: a-proteobacteria)]
MGLMHSSVRQLDRALSAVEGLMIWISVVALAAIGILIAASITMRSFGMGSVPDEVVFIEELTMISICGALAFAARTNHHITVDLFFEKFSPATQRACRMLACVVGAAFIYIVLMRAWPEAMQAIERQRFYMGELYLPQWPGRLVFAIGLIVLMARLALRFVQLATGQLSHDAQHES